MENIVRIFLLVVGVKINFKDMLEIWNMLKNFLIMGGYYVIVLVKKYYMCICFFVLFNYFICCFEDENILWKDGFYFFGYIVYGIFLVLVLFEVRLECV